MPVGSLRVDHFSLKLEVPQRTQDIIEMGLMSLVKTVDPDKRMQVLLGMYDGDPLFSLSVFCLHSNLININISNLGYQ